MIKLLLSLTLVTCNPPEPANCQLPVCPSSGQIPTPEMQAWVDQCVRRNDCININCPGVEVPIRMCPR